MPRPKKAKPSRQDETQSAAAVATRPASIRCHLELDGVEFGRIVPRNAEADDYEYRRSNGTTLAGPFTQMMGHLADEAELARAGG